MAKQPRGNRFVISAGLTTSGAPTYLRADGTWTSELQQALTVESPEERDRLLELARQQERIVSDPYAIPVEVVNGKIDPLTAREYIRANGPTVSYRRPDPVLR